MKKGIKMLLLLSSTILLASCGDTVIQESNVSSQVSQEQTVEVELVSQDREDSYTVALTEESLMEILKDNFTVIEDKGFLNGVDGLVANPDDKEFLSIYVNEEMAMTGATDIYLNNGDTVKISIENWE